MRKIATIDFGGRSVSLVETSPARPPHRATYGIGHIHDGVFDGYGIDDRTATAIRRGLVPLRNSHHVTGTAPRISDTD